MAEMIIWLLASTVMALGYLWAFWALYVFTMGIYRVYLAKKLKGLNFVFAIPIVVMALIVDILSNILATAVFLDAPKEWLVTSRLIRYKNGPADWRQNIANLLCEGLLDVFDPNGNHC